MNKYSKIWNDLEKKKKPLYLRKVKTIDSKKFYSLIDSSSPKIKKIIEDLYNGDFYLIKKSISEKFLNSLKLELANYSKKEKSSFHKMLDGCPNFWRRQSENIAKKYSFQAVRDSYYFFRWNKKEKDIWKTFDEMWGNLKFIGGLQKNSFIKNVGRIYWYDGRRLLR